MRLFYQTFKNCDTLRHELSWSHYRLFLRVKDETARNWYMHEAANQTWSTRQLDRLLIEEHMKREEPPIMSESQLIEYKESWRDEYLK